ncbi:MAG: carboxylesterase family protein [Gemmatimonadota bacterium]
MNATLMAAAAVVLMTSCSDPNAAPRATVGGETLEGVRSGEVAVFKGIPYAQPPVGPLRWKPPISRLAGAGVRSAAAFGASCMQPPSDMVNFITAAAKVIGAADKVTDQPLKTDEDCLSLNIWTGSMGSAPKPVMVWIHGGGNYLGSSSEAMYDGAALARRGVVVVTINYRLGVFGFLAHPALAAESPHEAAGNYGLMDQLEALRWVQHNIRAFGGDSSRVTVFGQSAGALDVTLLMASPQAKGLFQGAIAESGAPMTGMPDLKTSGDAGVALARKLGADTARDPLAALRAMRAGDVLAAASIYGPNVDGWVLPDVAARIFERGEQLGVPLLTGTNALEWASVAPVAPLGFELTAKGYRNWVTAATGPAAPRVLQLLPASSAGDVERAGLQLMTYFMFTCPTRLAARAVSKSGHPAYLYQFTRVPPGAEKLGAFHLLEIPYVFGNPPAWIPRDQTDDRLRAAIMDYWVRFATTGDPNGGTAPTWPAYEASGEPYLNLGDTVTPKAGMTKDVCEALEPGMRGAWAMVTPK